MNAYTTSSAIPNERPGLMGLAELMTMVFRGEDLNALHVRLVERATLNPDDADALMDLAVVLQLHNQREIGLDCMDWHKALKDAVRQDPDVILVGELRDVETFEAAIHAAETGHLVFGTIHAASSGTTINRILDLFPPEKHSAVRQGLANNLKAVIAQKLVKGLKKGRVPTNEIMIVNPTIRKLIIDSEDSKIPDAIRIGYQEGMQDFTESLRQLVENGDIDKATALEYAPNPEQLKMAFKGIRVAAPGIL